MEMAESQENGADVVWDDLLGALGTSKLPGDIMIQILTQLPIISILCFKSVCKAWSVLFKSPAFIRLHDRSLMTNRLSLLVHNRRGRGQGDRLSHLVEQASGNYVNKKIHFGDFDYIKVVGSINGLVCLNLCFEDAKRIVLWNPATRRRFQIPNPQLVVWSHESVTLGFAYDQDTNSYKVVRILYPRTAFCIERLVARVEIYNTRNNTWRMTEPVEFPWLTLHDGETVVSGVPYWFAPKIESSLHELIIWFDASIEIFRFHPLPPVDNNDESFDSVEAMGEHPVLMAFKHGELDGGTSCLERVDIRKLTKLDDGRTVSFQIDNLLVQLGPDFKHVVGIWRNGEIIALDQGYGLFLSGKEGNKHLAKFEHLTSPKVYNYCESLVWPAELA